MLLCCHMVNLFGRREGVTETGKKTSFMFWLSFIGNQPILSQWNESGGEQTKLVLREIPVKEWKTWCTSQHSLILAQFLCKPIDLCIVLVAAT